MMKTALLSLLSLFLFSTSAIGTAVSKYRLLNASDGTMGIYFSIGFTFGTHKGIVAWGDGHLNLSSKTRLVSSGSFSVPVKAMLTKNGKRDCHLREAMGLDYTKSKYPKSRACNSDHALPSEGDNSISYPNIIFKITSSELVEPDNENLTEPYQVRVKGEWEIHGIKMDEPGLLLSITPEKNFSEIRVAGEKEFSLKDFGIIVKNYFIVSVSDTAKVRLDLRMRR